MRDRNSWTPAFTAEGASATFGNVYEPYLGGTHYPHVYALALARGMSAGEAATAAMPFLSWQGVFVGDPMFKPFKTDLKKQMENIDAGEIDELSQYSVIRMVNSISKKGGARAAFDYASKYVGKMPDAALLWKLAQLAAADKNTSASEQLARDALSRDIYSKVSDRGLALEICSYLIPLSQSSREAARGSLERLAGLSEDGEYLVAVAKLAKELSKREELGGKLVGVVKRADAYVAQKAMERENKNAKK